MLRGLSTPRKNILGNKTEENEKEEREDNFAKLPRFFFFCKKKNIMIYILKGYNWTGYSILLDFPVSTHVMSRAMFKANFYLILL